MGRLFGFLAVLLLLITAVSIRFPHLFQELQAAVEHGDFELNEGSRQRFRADSLREINEFRESLSIEPIRIDTDLQDALKKYVEAAGSPSAIELKAVFQHLQNQFPGAQFLSANVCHSLTDRGLIDAIRAWQDVTNPDYESISTVIFKKGNRLGCIAVLARRIPEFNLTAANASGGRFFNRCPHCARTHAVELDRKSRTLVLACPDCGSPYDVLAADTVGRFYRANDFLLGFKMPRLAGATVDYDTPSEALLLHIWRTVVNHCEYENDNTRAAQREAWKTPDQTWLERSGDCEDTSILLADSLISAGIEARVAVGWNRGIGQHAWCVARIGDKQYLLESTIRDGKDVSILTTRAAQDDYRPEQLFDRQHLYFRIDGAESALSDYWSRQKWKAVNHGPPTKIARAVPE